MENGSEEGENKIEETAEAVNKLIAERTNSHEEKRKFIAKKFCKLLNTRSLSAQGTDHSKWLQAGARARSMEDPWEEFHLIDLPIQKAKRLRYSALTQRWTEDEIVIRMQKERFAQGAMRACYRLIKKPHLNAPDDWSHSMNFVAKRYMEEVDRKVYEDDIRLQMDAKLWAEEFDRHNPPKKIDMFQISLMQLHEEEGKPFYHLEHFIEGEYIKYNSNSGFVSGIARNTPQAFSHFTFERSGHQLIVVDVQGVGDLYTDPQIHTADGKEYGDGNLGTRGMALFFHSHLCNEVCRSMQLSPFDLTDNEKLAAEEAMNKDTDSAIASAAHTVCKNRSSSERCRPVTTDNLVLNATQMLRLSLSSAGSDEGIGDGNSDRTSNRCQSIDEEILEDEDVIEELDNHRRMRMQSEMAVEKTVEAEFWSDMRWKSRTSTVQLGLTKPIDAEHAILGQIHLDLAQYYESRRFDREDPVSALYHLRLAAACCNVPAMTAVRDMLLGRAHDVLVEEEMEVNGESIAEAWSLTQQMAELNDINARLLVAKTHDQGSFESMLVSPKDWAKSQLHYRMAIDSFAEAEDYLLQKYEILARLAEMNRTGGNGLPRDASAAGDLYNEAAEAAMEAMKGKMANKYYMLAEECYGEVEG